VPAQVGAAEAGKQRLRRLEERPQFLVAHLPAPVELVDDQLAVPANLDGGGAGAFAEFLVQPLQGADQRQVLGLVVRDRLAPIVEAQALVQRATGSGDVEAPVAPAWITKRSAVEDQSKRTRSVAGEHVDRRRSRLRHQGVDLRNARRLNRLDLRGRLVWGG
jgi:hypothetical protein